VRLSSVPTVESEPAMELLSDFDPSDQVSQLLRVIRIRSTVYCRSLMGAPWGFGVQAHGNPAFHVVTAGRCWLEVDGEPGQIPLAAGDLVLLPTGNRHWMRDAPTTPATELEEILAATPLGRHRRLRYGGSGLRTGLLCGGFAVEGSPAHPILRALCPAVVIRGGGGHPVPWLSATLGLLNAETTADAPGAHEVVTRLADALLTQALRAALNQLQSPGGAGLRALGDRHIAAAIELIHSRPEHGWTVGELASKVALSRSAFAARFRELAGESPLRYLTRTRLAHAADLLRTTDAPLAQIASRAGYGTEFSFSKAFKRTFGIAPGSYRERPGPPRIEILTAADLPSPATARVGNRSLSPA
jgi:AraC-like DNA-binding protein/mannose-6-phosphate isomerase-like protein (cupin superfamily)